MAPSQCPPRPFPMASGHCDLPRPFWWRGAREATASLGRVAGAGTDRPPTTDTYPRPHRRGQEQRQGPRKAHGPTFPHTGTAERGHQTARAGRYNRRTRAQLQRRHIHHSSCDTRRMTEVQKTEARRQGAEGATLAELARSYDVSQSTISRL